MLNSNKNQNSSPGATSPTDITSDQEGTINKNSIESGTEQSLQGSSVGNQDSLNDYVDASSTPVSEGINDTMQVADDNEVTSGNKGNRSVLSSGRTPLSEGSVNEQEDVTESKKRRRSASRRLQQSNELVNILEQQLKAKDDEMKDLQEQLNNQPNATLLKAKDDEIKDLQEQLNNQPNATLLKAKDDEIKDLQEQLNNRPSAAQLQARDEEITQLKAQVQQLQAKNAEVVELNKQLEESKSLVDKLQKEKQTLEDKSKTTEQPKQGNGAKYTATVGVGLAAGLIAFTALEHTVRLEMLVIIGIAVTSALVAGGITYAVLPSTQVDGAKEQEVNEMGKRSNKG
ncbi:ATP-binding protein [Wolbachia endosymbiont of Nasonia vitripennis]|uniref:ATP-binding protein n=2 Tax=Wolbachia TaxID=953 RepID=UPI0039C63E0E